ncbi:uncharacterized protein LOC132701507 isoform X2 [Cylas formicarius]|nr:uncharacterized protein LOC132701507 isoform X2 [Cylas formicarius]
MKVLPNADNAGIYEAFLKEKMEKFHSKYACARFKISFLTNDVTTFNKVADKSSISLEATFLRQYMQIGPDLIKFSGKKALRVWISLFRKKMEQS